MLKAGDTFHRYRIDGKLGEGGMGLVYRAYDPLLHREIALKIVRAEIARTPSGQLTEAAIRLMREGRAVASLNHPNAIGIFDVGEIDGTPYIAMELATGRLLSTFIGDKRVTVRQRLAWLSQIAHGLDAAHKQGLVHRDVKPENMMVCDTGEVKILDFGVVKRIAGPVVDPAEAPHSEPLQTRVGVVMGTPLYMAPEQALGEPIDGRSDQFSWATVAYELLSSGVHPTTSNNPRKLPIAFALLSGEPRPLAEVAPDLPPGVDAVVMRALSKLPAERFATMEAIFVELDAILEALGEPPSSSSDAHSSVTTVRPWSSASSASPNSSESSKSPESAEFSGSSEPESEEEEALDEPAPEEPGPRSGWPGSARPWLLAFAALVLLAAGLVGYRFMLK
ncbi:serine/threonine-protein kinase [Pendulispora albinea]|uniref:Serine/threonine protein kinase n=1 Tax=Pendulispora albinea TaxID=2741071 RepID=A0ABZ2M8Q5_9BACT